MIEFKSDFGIDPESTPKAVILDLAIQEGIFLSGLAYICQIRPSTNIIVDVLNVVPVDAARAIKYLVESHGSQTGRISCIVAVDENHRSYQLDSRPRRQRMRLSAAVVLRPIEFVWDCPNCLRENALNLRDGSRPVREVFCGSCQHGFAAFEEEYDVQPSH